MRPLGGAVERALRRLGLESGIARVAAVDAWGAVAREAFGPDGAGTVAVACEERTLVVRVPDAAWASEIRLHEAQLVAALARRAPSGRIERIRCVPAGGDLLGGPSVERPTGG
ncbi:MAG TPA: DUF721 domain-containing protein [Candidatus Limnocylindria bacterium]